MKSFASILALPLILSLAACGSHQSQEMIQSKSADIVAGTSVDQDDPIAHSTVGLILQSESGSQSSCTGTLIDKNIVLTAAHCFIGDESDAVQMALVVFTTSFDGITQDVIRPVVDVVIHPDFLPKAEGAGTWGDAALLKFEGDALAGYTAVPFLTDKSKLKAGMEMTIAGYGMTNAAGDDAKPGEEGGGTLMKAKILLKNPAYEGGELLSDMKESGTSTCKGDSGGPAYATIDGKLHVVGITSRGLDQRCDGASIFTSTAFESKFITSAVQSLNQTEATKTAQKTE